MRLRSLTSQFALALAAAALLPLVCFGVWSLTTFTRATRESVIAGNLRLTSSEAEHIERESAESIRSVEALASKLNAVETAEHQQLLLDAAVARSPELQHVAIFDASGRAIVGDARELHDEASLGPQGSHGIRLSAPRADANRKVHILVAMPLQARAQPLTLRADVSLEEITSLVESVKIGSRSVAMLVDEDGRCLAAGGDMTRSDARREGIIAAAGVGRRTAVWSGEYTDDHGVTHLGTAAAVPTIHATLLVEQPSDEAFAALSGLGHQLALAAVASLILMAAAGFVFGRRVIAPVLTLEHATRALADGHFDVRVPMQGANEVTRLARSFNAMADRLDVLRERVKSQERQVMFGRVVAGIFHDLSHPIETIANNARLLLEPSIDADERRAIGHLIARERDALQRFLDDMLNVARPRPLDRVPIDVNAVVADALDAARADADRAQVNLAGHLSAGAQTIAADGFALGRVFRNLIVNAVQATSPGGRVDVRTTESDTSVTIEVVDTGVGIPPDRLTAVFDDFVTTKKRGLGLGLASSRRIVEQLGGTIAVTSEVGRGSTFTVCFPRIDAVADRHAAAV
ncbi:MAG: ATP-binding protein [Vicinamibacterales bacterium]